MQRLTGKNINVFLNGLPPDEYLAYCDTDDQRSHWLELKIGYTYLNESFKAYFAGQADPIFDNDDAAFWYKLRDSYISLYGVLQAGWNEVKAFCDQENLGLSKYAKNPAECFIRMLEDDCAGTFSICLEPFYKATPNQDREWANLQRKLSRDPNGLSATSLDKKIRAIERDRASPLKYSWARFLFVDVCSKSKNEGVRDRVRDYRRKMGELDRYLSKLNHPSKGRKGGTWIKGLYQPSQ